MEQNELELAYLEGFLLRVVDQIDSMTNGKYAVSFEIVNVGLKPQNA